MLINVNASFGNYKAESRIKRTIPITVILIALLGPARAADTPQQLVQALAQAARNRDVAGFLTNMSLASQRALADAEATQMRLVSAEQSFHAALDVRFGKGHQVGPPQTPDRATVLSQLVSIELIKVQQETPSAVQLRLKTITKGPRERIATQEDTLAAVKEGGEWKLDLSDLASGATEPVAQRASAYDRVTQEIRGGAFEDRVSALIALANAERGWKRGAGK